MQLGISKLHPRVDGLSGNQTLKGKTNGKYVNWGSETRNDIKNRLPVDYALGLTPYLHSITLLIMMGLMAGIIKLV